MFQRISRSTSAPKIIISAMICNASRKESGATVTLIAWTSATRRGAPAETEYHANDSATVTSTVHTERTNSAVLVNFV